MLDITRLVSRFGMGQLTGIDRVERAYLKFFLKCDRTVWFVAKIGKKFAVVAPDQGQILLDTIDGKRDLPRPYFQDLVRLKISYPQRQARSLIRRLANKVCKLEDLVENIASHRFSYFNVGHSNLSGNFLRELKRAQCSQISVLIHDTIPLDYPEFTRPEVVVSFKRRMKAVAKYSDRVICNSYYTKSRVTEHFGKWAMTLNTIVAPLGIEQKFLNALGSASIRNPPYFVVLGTIEGRKNHAVAFEAWSRMLNPAKLHVIGKRGWRAEKAIDFLDSSPLVGRSIVEHSNLNDQELINMLSGARALLFPSFVEGFGLPAIEAATLGTPVIAADIPALREVLGENATFLDSNDASAWVREVEWAVCNSDKTNSVDWVAPTWDDHFIKIMN